MERPNKLSGLTIKHKTGCGVIYVTVNGLNNKPYEIFIKGNFHCGAMLESLSKSLSLIMREGSDIQEIITQFKGIRCFNNEDRTQSNCIFCITSTIQEYIKENFK